MPSQTAENVDVETDVLIVGAGPAAASLACFLGYYGVTGVMISRGSTTAQQPRAHVTNSATFECLRDIGLEQDFRDVSVSNSVYGEYRFCHRLTGPDFVRYHSFGKNPGRLGDYKDVSPCEHADVSQNVGEPLLIKYATQHGFQSRFDYKFLEYTKDTTTGHIISTIEDQISKRTVRILSKYLCAGDGAGSSVLRQTGLPVHDTSVPGAAALNIWFEADLTEIYRLNPGLLHAIVTPEKESPPWAIQGVLRVVRPYKEFVMSVRGLPGAPTAVSEEEAKSRLHDMIGDDNVDIKILGIYKWRINEAYAEKLSDGNIFALGDAIHRHPPGNGLGSNTCIQDAYNLAWKLAYVLQGRADPSLLDSYSAERQPIGQRIVKIANDTFRIHAAFLKALGLDLPTIDERMQALRELEEGTPAGVERRAKLKDAYRELETETEGLGGEMNQKYISNAVHADDESDPGPTWEGSSGTRFHIVSTFPGSRLPHAWLGTKKLGEKVSTHDIAGHAEFTIFTGVGGKAIWSKAAEDAMSSLNVKINVYSIGYGQDYTDMFFKWEERRSVDEDGAILIRPDRVVAWRSNALGAKKLPIVMRKLLGYESS